MDSSSNATTRRTFLCAVGGASLIGLAGCSRPRDVEVQDYMVDELPHPTRGGGGLTVTVFEDMMCPRCRDFTQNVYPRLNEDYIETGKITLQFRDYPITVNDQSYPAAYAGRYIQQNVGQDEFWAYLKRIYEAQPDINSTQGVLDVAAESGVRRAEVEDAISRDLYYPVVNGNRQYASENGVTATPTLFLGSPDTSVEGGSAVDWETVSTEILNRL